MGMYTKLNVKIELDDNHPDYDKAVAILCHMLYFDNCHIHEYTTHFKHELFKTRRWEGMMHSSSAYFGVHDPSYLKDGTIYADFDMKNYDQEIEKFLDWIYPLSRSRGVVGTYRYEESEVDSQVVFGERGFELIEKESEEIVRGDIRFF